MVDGHATVGDLQSALERLGMSGRSLWIAYFAVGGNASRAEVESWVSGAAELHDREYDLLAQALNDQFAGQDLDHPVPYRCDL